MISNFGGTVALGLLVSVTLLFAMMANLLLLPSLLLSLERMITTRSFREPLIDILDEEEDTCEKLSFGVFHFFHFFAHPQISRF